MATLPLSKRRMIIGAIVLALLLIAGLVVGLTRDDVERLENSPGSSNAENGGTVAPNGGPSTVFTQNKIESIYMLGDSFASGEGLAPYDADSEVTGCHRSPLAFVQIAAEQFGAKAFNLACSGASTSAITESFRGEPSQLSRLDPSASVVLIMIGGNDIDALSYVVGNKTPGDLGPELGDIQAKLADIYTKVRQKAPNATIYAMGYPSIVPFRVGANCPYPQEQVTLFREATVQLNARVGFAANDAKVKTILSFSAFDGHELCTEQPWVNPLGYADPDVSLHPNPQGHVALSREVVNTLRQ